MKRQIKKEKWEDLGFYILIGISIAIAIAVPLLINYIKLHPKG